MGVVSLVLAATEIGGRAAPGLIVFVMGPMHGLLGWRHGVAVERVATETGILPGDVGPGGGERDRERG